jgi:hypothetical protein
MSRSDACALTLLLFVGASQIGCGNPWTPGIAGTSGQTDAGVYTPPPTPTCGQRCQDYLVGLGLDSTIWLLYNENVAGTPSGNTDRTGRGPLGGSVHITGTTSVAADKTTTLHLVFNMTSVANSSSDYSLTFSGTVAMDGTFQTGANKFTAITWSTSSIAIAGSLQFLDNPAIDETCDLSETQQDSSNTSTLDGRLCGRDFNSDTALKNLYGASDAGGGTGGGRVPDAGAPGSGGGVSETWSGTLSGAVTDALDCIASGTNANWGLNGTLTITTSGAPLASGGGGKTSSITYVATQPLTNGYDPGTCTAISVSYSFMGSSQAISRSGGSIVVDFSSNGGGNLSGSESPSNQAAVTGGGPPTVGGAPMCDPVIGNPVLTGTINGSTYSGTWITSGSSVGGAFGTSAGQGSFTLTKR